ncbi:methyl-accepting chemotaxis protein [Paenibacillus sp. J5C_2022]|uniref:methyl-accepting chemotaxis protein n=1 Tax=Paenibacillus sp. J5C2022 TaxID=2977129 RepID=UPI0021D02292|nr:methyl-accepting chemotaxis protein [Paenibacillus sp. J5C2022]MCU6712485.1 methyl-accepting chemotaxis protein [Paenibacillus sp. J5C2022]
MFDWLGAKTGLPLWISWQLNKDIKKDVEAIFEGFAENRKALLINWAADQWRVMERLSLQLQNAALDVRLTEQTSLPLSQIERLLHLTYARAEDITELFLLDNSHTVAASTCRKHIGKAYGADNPLQAALTYCYAKPGAAKQCLLGPYRDPLTNELGARSSSFHDAVTLLFLLPVAIEGRAIGTLCGRVPNDVIGDLIQRESGHIYPDSGDNYLFMAEPVLQRHIMPGTALSRSRFEDRTFTHGENLKDGVTTQWGTVSVQEHTELELQFNDPATGELHPGVANTIRNGSNLFVAFPGYSDYRHIPVIGKGVTFQLPHCPDKWGMMCEGDLEEVYRVRSIGWRQRRLHILYAIVSSVIIGLLTGFLSMYASSLLTGMVAGFSDLLLAGILFGWISHGENKRVVSHMRTITRFIRMNAEGNGDLTMRLTLQDYEEDELKDMAKWLNNMIDSLEGIMLQVRTAAQDVATSGQAMHESASVTAESTGKVSGHVTLMMDSIRRQLSDIDMAKASADTMRDTLLHLEQQASGQIALAQQEVDRIGVKMQHISVKVDETHATIRAFMSTVDDIRSILQVIEQISAQTHLLALNASIEAARVGEQGKGFAVVANEIRKLAAMTRQSTEEVHAVTQTISTEATRAFASMEEGANVVEEGNRLVAAAISTLNEAGGNDSRRSEVVDEVVRLLDSIAQVSSENGKVSAVVERRVSELFDEMGNVQQMSQNVEAITMLLQGMVNQFKLTEARMR